jgi:hypothetical protein
MDHANPSQGLLKRLSVRPTVRVLMILILVFAGWLGGCDRASAKDFGGNPTISCLKWPSVPTTTEPEA